MTDRSRRLLSDLSALLDREHACAMEGDLTALADLSDDKQSLLEMLATEDVADAAEFSRLREMAMRNGAILKSVAEGIDSVARRLETLGRVRQSLETYDEDGKKRSVKSVIDRTLERRA